MKLKQIPWMLAAGLTLSASPALAQDADPAEATAAPAPAPEVSKAQLEALEKLIEAQTKRLEALEKAGEAASEKAKELEAQLATAEEERMDLTTQMMEAQDTGEKIFSIFGFLDAGFGYYPYEKGNLLSTYVIPEASFVTSNVNLYFKSQLTSQLETLIETRFTFAPNGQESFPTEIRIGDVTASETGEYSRESAEGTDKLTNASFKWGGVVIERAHIDYKPFEWLKFRLGRFLTPYGIWNVDHGSPVLIGTSLPQLVAAQLVPNNQTGLQVFGRVFPSDSMRLDYAAFLTNGRGPTEAIYDLDSNKALGGRAKLSMTFGELDARLGVFGYYGKYTDATQKIVFKANPDLTVDFTQDNPVGTERTITEQYNEATFAADLDLRAYGLRLFGEFLVRKVTFDVRPDRATLSLLANGGRLSSSAKQSDYFSKAGYVILTYDLALDFLKKGMFVRPYAGFERIVSDDSTNDNSYSIYRAGLNLHPNPYMVFKFQAVRFDPDRPEVLGPFWGYTTQVAVSF